MKRKDVNEIAFAVVQQAIGLVLRVERGKNSEAMELGRLGGLKGGKARAAILSSKKKKQIAKKAALARWRKPNGR